MLLREIQATKRRKVDCSVALASILLLCPVSPGIAAEGIPAVRARDFLDSIGVCTHIGQGIDNPSRSAAALACAGVRNIRDDGSPRHVQDWIAVHEQAGVKVVRTWSGPDDRHGTDPSPCRYRACFTDVERPSCCH
jgi:hypothetical protein